MTRRELKGGTRFRYQVETWDSAYGRVYEARGPHFDYELGTQREDVASGDCAVSILEYRPTLEPDRETAPDPYSPAHYSGLVPQPIDVVSSWNLDFYRGNVLKYIARAGRKGGAEKYVEDLKKARQYLDWAIEKGAP